MQLNYHPYRPIPPRKTLNELMREAVEPDKIRISQYYNQFFFAGDEEPDRFNIAWGMAEIAWIENMSRPIHMDLHDVFSLKFASADLDRELPPMTLRRGVYCYEFPVELETYISGDLLTSLLVVNGGPGEKITTVFQFSDGHVIGHLHTAEEIVAEANKALTLPKSLNHEDVTALQAVLFNYRLQMIVAYHLCNGFEAWSDFWNLHYADRYRELEEDDPADWWKKG